MSPISTYRAAEQADPFPSPTRAEKALQTDMLALSAAKAGHPKVVADIAFQAVSSVEDAPVQFHCPMLGLLPPHASQSIHFPPPHLPIPSVIVSDAFCPDQDYQVRNA